MLSEVSAHMPELSSRGGLPSDEDSAVHGDWKRTLPEVSFHQWPPRTKSCTNSNVAMMPSSSACSQTTAPTASPERAYMRSPPRWKQLATNPPTRLILTGNAHFFSAGADLNEIAALTGPEAFRFAHMGQHLMRAVASFPAPTIAAVHGYCMGGGLDLALSCQRRIAGPHAIFGHRGAALGLITGWGGTQRLPRLIGKGRALQMFLAAEKVHPVRALQIGLVDAVADDPLAAALALSHGGGI